MAPPRGRSKVVGTSYVHLETVRVDVCGCVFFCVDTYAHYLIKLHTQVIIGIKDYEGIRVQLDVFPC